MAVTAAPPLPGNLIKYPFQEMSTAWTVLLGTTPTITQPSFTLEGSQSMLVTAAAAGSVTLYANQGAPNWLPANGTPMVWSVYMYASNNYSTGITGSMGYVQGNTLTYTNVTGTTPLSRLWTCVNGTSTTFPTSGTQGASVAIQLNFTAAGQGVYVDLAYLANSEAQVLVDWTTPAFTATQPTTGDTFVDITPFIDLNQAPITMTHGRQDAISEVQNGQFSCTVDNTQGWFTANSGNSPWGNVTIGARLQWNQAYRSTAGHTFNAFRTRFDGSINELDYTVAPTSTQAFCAINAKDVIGYLSQLPELGSWTQETVLADGPLYLWPLNDPQGSQTAREMSGNNGPNLAVQVRLAGTSASFGGTPGGIETFSNVRTGPVHNTIGATPYSSPIAGWGQSAVPQNGSGTNGAGASPLVAKLPGTGLQIISPTGWSLEWWATPDPSQMANFSASNSARMGMISLSNGLTLTLEARIWWNSNNNNTGVDEQSVQMAMFQMTNTFTGNTVTSGLAPSSPPGQYRAHSNTTRPYHYVITCSNAGTFTLYEDGVSLGSFSPTGLNQMGQVGLNMISVGDATGQADGSPNAAGYPGSIQMVSVYQYVLTSAQIIKHASIGQAGYYGQKAGNAIAGLASFANLPPFWVSSSVTGPGVGLSNLDWYDITGQNPLSAMQQAEQAEVGLLYAPYSGQLTFASRAARMAIGAADVTLPMGSFTADLGTVVTDQYIQTQAAFEGGASVAIGYAESGVESRIGTYAPNGSVAQPTQLPIITNAPGNPQIAQPMPYATDLANWNVNLNDTPPFKAVNVTVDLLTLVSNTSDPENALSNDAIAALDVNSVVSLMNVSEQVPQLPNNTGALDFFVEGVAEAFSLTTHTLEFYTSPAQMWRCWIPGDSTYGVLGSTTVLGISHEPNSATATDSVNTFDPGLPWYPPGQGAPAWSSTMNQGEGTTPFVGVSDLRGITETLRTLVSPPMYVGGFNWGGSGGPTSQTNVPLNVMVDTWNSANGLMGTGSKYVIPVSGYYEIAYAVQWSITSNTSTSTVESYANIIVDDLRIFPQDMIQTMTSSSPNNSAAQWGEAMHCRDRMYLAAGATVRLQSSNNVAGRPLQSAWLSIQFLGFSQVVD